MLRHVSNFTDFDILERDPRVHLYYSSNPTDLDDADIIILPGTKSTIDDLYHLRRNSLAEAIIRARRRGATVLGICGGYQMMGREVCDPDHVEGDQERLPGLALLPVTTTMSGEKRTRQVQAQLLATLENDAVLSPQHTTLENDAALNVQHTALETDAALNVQHTALETDAAPLSGYEIHMGTTNPLAQPSPLLHLSDGTDDGYWVDQHCMGTYVHGILDNVSL